MYVQMSHNKVGPNSFTFIGLLLTIRDSVDKITDACETIQR